MNLLEKHKNLKVYETKTPTFLIMPLVIPNLRKDRYRRAHYVSTHYIPLNKLIPELISNSNKYYLVFKYTNHRYDVVHLDKNEFFPLKLKLTKLLEI